MQLALKLFVLRDSSGAIVNRDNGKPLYFHNKMAAKDHKKSLSGVTFVIPGPDHRKYKGAKK